MKGANTYTPGPWEVSAVGSRKYHINPTPKDVINQETVRNCQLIAAAPDLYEALDRLYLLMYGSVEDEADPLGLAMARAKAALNKAEGAA